MRLGLLLSIIVMISTPAFAVYKCESHGKVTYADMPCGPGQSQLPPSPPPADPLAAQRLAKSEREQLAAIEQREERLQSERQKEQAARNKAAAALKKKCSLLAMQSRWSAEDAAANGQLVSEKTTALKRQARRKAERFEAECRRS